MSLEQGRAEGIEFGLELGREEGADGTEERVGGRGGGGGEFDDELYRCQLQLLEGQVGRVCQARDVGTVWLWRRTL